MSTEEGGRHRRRELLEQARRDRRAAMSEITDAEIGAYDQGLAEADAEIDRLLSILQIAIREVGEHQAMASVFLLVSQRDRDTLTGLLMTALRRLAGNGDAGDERA